MRRISRTSDLLALLLGAVCLFHAAPAAAQQTLWPATLTLGHDDFRSGCSSGSDPPMPCSDQLDDDDFVYEGTTYKIVRIEQTGSADATSPAFGFDRALSSAIHSNGSLTVGSSNPSLSDIGSSTSIACNNVNHTAWTDNKQVFRLTIPNTKASLPASAAQVAERSGVTVTVAAALQASVTVPLAIRLDNAHAGGSVVAPSVTIPAGQITGRGTIFTTPGTAKDGDFRMLSSIPISANQRTRTGTTSTGRDVDEQDQTFVVALDTASLHAKVLAGTPRSRHVRIRNTADGNACEEINRSGRHCLVAWTSRKRVIPARVLVSVADGYPAEQAATGWATAGLVRARSPAAQRSGSAVVYEGSS
ncbi:MAG: hypothetical protein OXP66_06475 [Candidatus Tectomicrobia bacterium]|nr:hypothetical protein [Candidatus Tectomicrobia bacterium]